MTFENEHLLPGQVGHFFVLLAFVASIISTIAYFKSFKSPPDNLSAGQAGEKQSWLRFARGAFFIQAFSLLAVFACIYYICSQHYFEYRAYQFIPCKSKRITSDANIKNV